jgi:preprotein translocase subunit SecD
MLNHYPWWKNLLIALVVFAGFIYSLPNIFGEDAALQISALREAPLDEAKVAQILDKEKLIYTNIAQDTYGITVRFTNPETQLKAMEAVSKDLGDQYIVALNLVPATPKWLRAFGAEPMKLGLDLRGGVHLLLEVNVPEAVEQREKNYVTELRTLMREERIRYSGIDVRKEGGIQLRFRDDEQRQAAIQLIVRQYPEYDFTESEVNNIYMLDLNLRPTAQQEIESYAVEQNMTTMRNRVNELGVAEAVVQRQGANRIVVQLPGILDPARAKDTLGKTARLEFRLVDTGNTGSKIAPPGTTLYYDRTGRPLFLQNQVLLSGDSIIGAQSGYDEYGKPEVQVQVGGNTSQFSKATEQNIGKPMAALYIETSLRDQMVDGQMIPKLVRHEEIISVATIQSGLGNRFRITGLASAEESRNLALLLRAGALAATTTIIEERTVGPSLGEENIKAGMYSVAFGLFLVLIAMMIYYRWFGVLANVALIANLFLLIAALSLIQATLTLPAIAAIVLTLGMAVDANVLIFERIREELRLGHAPQMAINAGFERALTTIMDSNITTFIAAVVLFSIGSGPIRGFAITLILGLMTSVFTAVMVTRALVNAWYGNRNVKKLSIGI